MSFSLLDGTQKVQNGHAGLSTGIGSIFHYSYDLDTARVVCCVQQTMKVELQIWAG